MSLISNALVVGAGPAGMSAAIALSQTGVDVDIVETSTDLGTIGSELFLSGSFLRSLVTLGAADGCVARGAEVTETRFCGPDGVANAVIPLPRLAGDGLPPAVGITRPALHKALADAARPHDIAVRTGVSASAVEDAEDGASVTFSDGASARYDLVVGADGVRSQLRAALFPEAAEPHATGQAVWRARLPRTVEEPALTLHFGPTNKAGTVPVSAGEMYMFCVVNQVDRIPRERMPEVLRDELAAFGGPIGAARENVRDPEHIHYSPLQTTLLPAPWYRGRVVLIGDAAHATTPHLAYGAGIAVEDGLVLADVLDSEPDLGTALERFMARRYERCRMVVENGVQLGEWERDPDAADADPAGLTDRSWMALAEAI